MTFGRCAGAMGKSHRKFVLKGKRLIPVVPVTQDSG